jgi:hypothetical protein
MDMSSGFSNVCDVLIWIPPIFLLEARSSRTLRSEKFGLQMYCTSSHRKDITNARPPPVLWPTGPGGGFPAGRDATGEVRWVPAEVGVPRVDAVDGLGSGPPCSSQYAHNPSSHRFEPPFPPSQLLSCCDAGQSKTKTCKGLPPHMGLHR